MPSTHPLAAGLLVANRGEIAIRIIRAATDAGIRTVAIHPADDADSLHVGYADEAVLIPGRGAAAYLDMEAVLGAARGSGCAAVHPGYGFLSEDADFASRCEQAGLVFVGPPAQTLALFGDKVAARRLAVEHGVPVAAATDGAIDVELARTFFQGLGEDAAVLVKAVSGGGGRGMREVRSLAELEEALERARSESRSAFGRSEVYLEQIVENARHVEIQVLGDGTGAVTHFGERECSIQRRHQKLIEIAPAVGLADEVRQALIDHAVTLAQAVSYRGLGTFEFLVGSTGSCVFIEANPRLQVEHTVTEEVTGVDLVGAQLAVAGGTTLAELGLNQERVPAPHGRAIQVRVAAESIAADGVARASSGTVAVFQPPTGPGIRVDTHCYSGYGINPAYDSLLAKVIVHAASADMDVLARKADRALADLRTLGVRTNTGLLRAILARPELVKGTAGTTFVETRLAELVAAAPPDPTPPAVTDERVAADVPDLADDRALRAPMSGVVLSLAVGEGDTVTAGAPLLVLEAMKMETVVRAPYAATLAGVLVEPGEQVQEGRPLLLLDEGAAAGDDADLVEIDLDEIRPDLAELLLRRRLTLDEARPEAVQARHSQGRRTARENVADLCDPTGFIEYGALAIGSLRARRDVDELIVRTPADGLVAGIGSVNGVLVGPERAQCAVMSYDYTVLAGTQGHQGHRKKDRLFELIDRLSLPLVFFTEGGGGRPGETDYPGVGYGDMPTFSLFARLSGRVPLVGVASGHCFAGNAALLGCCDVIIATRDASIGMGGPAMIEGGGLGRFAAADVGPVDVHTASGVVDVLVDDDAAAVAVARQYLSYFQGSVAVWEAPDQRLLRHAVPENRRRSYDVHAVIDGLADIGSVLELRSAFAPAMVACLARIEGRPVGILANNPAQRGGAIDADGADKAARFVRLCQDHGLPLVTLCDTPGFMVGLEAEKQAQVRRFAQLFLCGANLTVPTFTIILRKAYGLGAIAMAGGGWRTPVLTAAWPTGELGGMGVEGSVRLGYRRELEAIADDNERRALFDQLVQEAHRHGSAINAATYFEIDDVIDPAETRSRLVAGLRMAQTRAGATESC
ncbi:biotin-dependent enzyme [Kribbella sp. VKM Ac-2527]|uniref:Biotin-dependent enzyme n=1 Tax=Kribbella caucasensis TaxID=2512215 RepID=A0A4R6KMH6_9ACTN|nr:carboxyl transferase domain-containing protein [Kribbella sp. VKM Ac-2527]TDO50535.1 biotin-dependent enzyme [Kribbella sp. VKM Ac-2527]